MIILYKEYSNEYLRMNPSEICRYYKMIRFRLTKEFKVKKHRWYYDGLIMHTYNFGPFVLELGDFYDYIDAECPEYDKIKSKYGI